MENFQDRDIEERITNSVNAIIEQVLWSLNEQQELYRERAMELIGDCYADSTAAIGLTTDQELSVVEEGAAEYGFQITFSLESLRGELESYAILFIHMIAEGRAFGIFSDLFDFMEEHSLEPEQMRTNNHLGWLPHTAEREVNPSCTIYEYRHVEESENHIDLWEYRFPGGERVWFEVTIGQ